MPPSGAKTSSPCAMNFRVTCNRLAGSLKNVASHDGLDAAVGKTEKQTTAFVERLEAPYERPPRQPRLHLLAEAAGAVEPVGTNGRKPLTGAPTIKPPHHRCRQDREQIVGGNHNPKRRKIGSRIRRLHRMVQAVHADPNRQRKP